MTKGMAALDIGPITVRGFGSFRSFILESPALPQHRLVRSCEVLVQAACQYLLVKTSGGSAYMVSDLPFCAIVTYGGVGDGKHDVYRSFSMPALADTVHRVCRGQRARAVTAFTMRIKDSVPILTYSSHQCCGGTPVKLTGKTARNAVPNSVAWMARVRDGTGEPTVSVGNLVKRQDVEIID
jgi:hypothetical protein